MKGEKSLRVFISFLFVLIYLFFKECILKMSNLCTLIYLGTWKGMEIIKRVSIYYNNIIVYSRGSRDFRKIPYTPKTRLHDNMIKIKMYRYLYYCNVYLLLYKHTHIYKCRYNVIQASL